jgi:hypothetical protein
LKQIIDAITRLDAYCVNHKYKGYDPYDALKSPIFRLPVLRSNKLMRFGMQQLVKRSPLNLRPLLGIPKGYNPVTLGLFIQGYSYLAQSSELRAQGSGLRAQVNLIPNTEYRLPITYKECLKKIEFLINELKSLIPPGYSGACWGYDFPWEARNVNIPAYLPTVVATGIISNALFECYRITGIESARDLCISSGNFIMKDLNRTIEDETFCFSYSPFDRLQVFNASMKGSRLLSQVYSLTCDEQLKIAASLSVRYVVNHQKNDGSWFYSNSDIGGWIDNYHTGYVLDCLDEYCKNTGDTGVSEAIDRGFLFYKANFIDADSHPKFLHNRLWPLDCTATAQTILTLSRFGNISLAKSVAEYIIENMQSSNGGFYFRKYRYHTEKTIFMRWSNAWMFAALSYLLMKSMIGKQ